MDWTTFYQTRHTRTQPLLIAHRGASLLAPENSLAAFTLALAQGADVLETDLRITRDGQIMLFHDSALSRTSNGSGPLFAYSLAELKALRLRGPGATLSDERIPTLLELLVATQGQVPLLLELKDWRFVQRRYAEQLAHLLAAYGVLAKSAIISFNQALTASIRAVSPALPVGRITMIDPFPRGEGQLLGPVWPLLYFNPTYVAQAHRHQRIVAPLDTTPAARMSYYYRLGVDAVLADDPAAALVAMRACKGRIAYGG